MDADQDQERKEERRIEERPQRQDRRALSAGQHQTYSGLSFFQEQGRRRRRLGRELQELDRRIEASDGYRFRSSIRFLEKSYFIFDVNYLNLKRTLEDFEFDLERTLEGFEHPMVFLRLWEEKNRDLFDLSLNDIIRFFHNYLAGATTLLDHVRALRGETSSSGGMDLSEEYRVRWDQQFDSSSLNQFMEDLLDYILHEGLPLAVSELSFGRVGRSVEINSVIRLDAGELGEWERWSEGGRGYLDTLENKVRLDRIVDEHATVVAGFYRWFVSRQSELNREAIEALEALEGERKRLQQEISYLEGVTEIAEKTPVAVREERYQHPPIAREERVEPTPAAQEERDEPIPPAQEARGESTPDVREEGIEPAPAAQEERLEPMMATAQEERGEYTPDVREERTEPAPAAQEEDGSTASALGEQPATAMREEQGEPTTTGQEGREILVRELEAERRYREWDRERMDRLEAQLERELNKGFWGRLFR